MTRRRFSLLHSKVARVLASTLLLNNWVFAASAEDEYGEETLPVVSDHKAVSTSEKNLIRKYLKTGEYMPVSEIKPGMEGYGLTVFQGTKIERFNVKVIGVVKRVLNNRDAILVRLSGAGMAKNNVIKGMSGSPVYIGGKLIGAVSYGFDFSTEPLAGITPIVDMLDALAEDSDESAAGPDRISRLDLPTITPSVIQTTGGQMPTSTAGAAPHMVPLMAPVALAGFSSRAEKFLADKFNDIGLHCSSGSSGGMDESLSKSSKQLTNPFTPGSAVAVMLTTGDFTTAATGTTTASFGGKVLAFGHPFLQAGFVDFPMASAYIHQVMPSLAVSFKVSSPMKLLGSVVSDRPWAVGGLIGKTPRTIQATYNVTDETRHLQHTYHCNIVDHPDLTPELMAATAMSAIDATHQSSAPYILKVNSTLETTSGGKVQRTDRYASHFSAHASSLDPLARLKASSDPVAAYLQAVGHRIMDNEFKRESIKSINLNIALEDGHKAAKLERIYVENPIVEPGDTVKVSCVIRPYNQERVTKTIELAIPRDVPDGNIPVAVASGDELEGVRRRLGLTDPPPENMEQILNKIRRRGRGDELCAILALPAQSITVGGTTLLNPPAHWNKLFLSDRYTRGAVLSRGEIRSSIFEDYLIDGAHIMTVEVRRKDKASARSQPMTVPASSVANSLDAIAITDLAKKTIGKVDTTAITTATTANANGLTATLIQTPATSPPTDKVAAPPPAVPFWTSSNKHAPHTRSLQVWSQESEAEFRNGKTDSTTIDSWGRITAGFQKVGRAQISQDMRIWSSTYSNGHFYFSTSNKIFKWNESAKAPELVANLNAVAIPSLVSNSKGMLYAACVPGSRVYAIDPSKPVGHNTSQLVKLSEPLVTSLAFDINDNLYIGVTGSGKVYKTGTDASTKPVQIFDSGQAKIVSLFYCQPERKIYVGTAEKGAVYSIDESGQAKAEYQSPDHIVTGIAKDKEGNLYVASAGSGHLVKIDQSGQVDTLATSDAFYTLYYDAASDHVYSGDGEGDITEAHFDKISGQSYFVPVSHTEQEAVAALTSDGKGLLFAGTCNLGIANLFEMKAASQASYTSEVRDGQRRSKWSRLRAFGGYNEVSEAIRKALTVETRTGMTSQPDVSWSAWVDAPQIAEAYEIKSRPGRYLQYRLTWKTDEIKDKPVAVGKVDVTYLPSNASPQISQVSLKSGAAVNGKQEITINGTDGDGDNLMLAMQLSPDGGKTWQTVVSDLRSIKAAKEETTKSVTTSTSTTTVEQPEVKKTTTITAPPAVPNPADELPKEVPPPGGPPKQWEPEGSSNYLDEKIPDEADKPKDNSGVTKIELVEDKAAAPTPVKKKVKPKTKLGPSAEANVVTSTAEGHGEKFTIKWDTTKFKEGNYIVRFTLDDKLSNAFGSEQTSVLRTIDVDNTPPQILGVDWTKGKSGEAKLRVGAKDRFTPIVNATYKLDDGEPLALTGVTDAGDGLNVVLGADEITFAKHPHKVEVVVSDRAGNSITKTIDVD